jgi:hypothetical protein
MVATLITLALVQAPRIDTPQGTVRAFVEAVNRAELKRASGYVAGGVYTYPAQRLESFLRKAFAPIFTLESIQDGVAEGNSAAVRVQVTMAGKPMPPETVAVARTEAGWRIVPPIPGPDTLRERPAVGAFVLAFASPLSMLALVQPIALRAGGSDVWTKPVGKDIALLANFVLMFGAMNGDVFPKDDADLRRGLAPFLKSGSPQLQPIAQNIDRVIKQKQALGWRFNPYVAGKPQASVTAPMTTVLIYEDREGNLDYRHDGKALIATTSGTVHLVSPAEAKNYAWKP